MKDRDKHPASAAGNKKRPFRSDPAFWLGLIAAPLCWCLLWILGLPVNDQLPDLELLFWSSMVYPVLEEIVFRGGLQSALLTKVFFAQSFARISLANVLTSAVFAAFHLLHQDPFWAFLVFIPSLVFGAARERYGTLSASIILHMFYNAGFITLFFG